MGLVVGIVVVAQTLYASTIDHINEFATLRAMGAENRFLYNIIVLQAVISAIVGYALGLGIGFTIAKASEATITAIVVCHKHALVTVLATGVWAALFYGYIPKQMAPTVPAT